MTRTLQTAIDRRMTEREARYTELARLPKNEIFAKADQIARLSGQVSMRDSKWDLIMFIIDQTMPVDALERRLKKLQEREG